MRPLFDVIAELSVKKVKGYVTIVPYVSINLYNFSSTGLFIFVIIFSHILVLTNLV